jgi:hypothetical protein
MGYKMHTNCKIHQRLCPSPKVRWLCEFCARGSLRTLHFIREYGYRWLHPTEEINVAAKYMRKYVPSNSTNQTKVSSLHIAYKLCLNHLRYMLLLWALPTPQTIWVVGYIGSIVVSFGYQFRIKMLSIQVLELQLPYRHYKWSK